MLYEVITTFLAHCHDDCPGRAIDFCPGLNQKCGMKHLISLSALALLAACQTVQAPADPAETVSETVTVTMPEDRITSYNVCYTKLLRTLFEKRVNAAELPYFVGLKQHLAAKGYPCPSPIAARDGTRNNFV